MTMRRITKEIKAELDRLKGLSRNGRLHWEAIVTAARDPANPLHSYFDWNKQRAIEHYVRTQAEELIASYTVVVMTDAGEKVRTRAFISLSTDRASGGGYRYIMDVMSDDELKAQMLQDALADLAAFKERYKKLTQLSAIFSAIEKAEATHGKRKRTSGRRGSAESSDSARAHGI